MSSAPRKSHARASAYASVAKASCVPRKLERRSEAPAKVAAVKSTSSRRASSRRAPRRSAAGRVAPRRSIPRKSVSGAGRCARGGFTIASLRARPSVVCRRLRMASWPAGVMRGSMGGGRGRRESRGKRATSSLRDERRPPCLAEPPASTASPAARLPHRPVATHPAGGTRVSVDLPSRPEGSSSRPCDPVRARIRARARRRRCRGRCLAPRALPYSSAFSAVSAITACRNHRSSTAASAPPASLSRQASVTASPRCWRTTTTRRAADSAR